MIPIPFNRPTISDSEYLSVMEVMNGDWLSEGPVTAEFEKELERYLGAHVCVVNSGSSALMCALLASGLMPNDLVVVPAITHIATLTAPYILGAHIRIVDVELDSFNMPPKDWDVGADFVIPVDVAGLPCKLGTDAPVIVDSAQSFGSSYLGLKVRRTHCFSFQMTKQLTTVEGGCIASHDKELIDRCRRIKNYGRTKEQYVHDIIGTNWRTTDINSAIGLEQLKHIDDVIERRKAVNRMYRVKLEGVTFPTYDKDQSPMFCFAMVEDGRAPKVLNDLRKVGIDARRIWMPLNMQPCLITDMRVFWGSCANAMKIYENTISLPISNGITDTEVETVIKEFNRLVSM